MNTIFTSLYLNVNKIFTINEWVYKPIPESLINFIGNVYEDADQFKFSINDKIDVYIVRNGNEICNKYVMVDNKLAIMCIIPKDIYSLEIKKLINMIYKIYVFIIGYIYKDMYEERLPSLFKHAEDIFTLHTILSNFKVEYDEFELPFINKKEAEFYHRYSITELYDEGMILLELKGAVSIDKSNDENS